MFIYNEEALDFLSLPWLNHMRNLWKMWNWNLAVLMESGLDFEYLCIPPSRFLYYMLLKWQGQVNLKILNIYIICYSCDSIYVYFYYFYIKI